MANTHIELDEQTTNIVNTLVRNGQFDSAEEAVKAGMLKLEAAAERAETLNSLRTAKGQLDRGEAVPMEEAFSTIRERVKATYPNAKL